MSARNRLSIEEVWQISVDGIGGDNYDKLRALALQFHDTMRENERLRIAMDRALLELDSEDNQRAYDVLNDALSYKESAHPSQN